MQRKVLEMKKIKLSENVEVSTIGLGTWAIGGGDWWGDSEDERSVLTIQTALDAGINLIDTAPGYGFGHSEKIVGEAIKGRRSEVILSTKCGLWWHDSRGSEFFQMDNYNVNRSLDPETIKAEVELSLNRLQTDYIDIYFTHWQSVPPCFTKIEETMNCLMSLKEQGVIRSIGASNVTKEHILEYLKYGELDVIQEKYSMLDRRIEGDLAPVCAEHNIAVMAYSPLEQGLLAGKITRDYVINPKEARAQIPWMEPKKRSLVLDMLDSWKELTQKYNCTISQLVLAWTIDQDAVSHVLCGARRPENIKETAAAHGIELSKQDINKMKRDILKVESISKGEE